MFAVKYQGKTPLNNEQTNNEGQEYKSGHIKGRIAVVGEGKGY
jgi:hypothetical protein